MEKLYRNIKMRREELRISQDELAKKLNYKSRSSINKIELGINDLPQSKIKEFAVALDTTVSALMGWDEFDEQIDTEELSKAVNLLEMLQEQYGKEAVQLLEAFTKLNPLGKEKALETLSDLTDLPKYTTEETEFVYRAARSKDHTAPQVMKRDKERMSRLANAPKVTKSEDL